MSERLGANGWNHVRRARRAMIAAVALLVTCAASFAGVAAQPELPPDFSPAADPARVIAQGVVELTGEEVVWRTIRERVEPAENAPFIERPTGFVVAADGPLLLVDQSGERVRLAPGEASYVTAGTVQQRASLGDESTTYLALELVAADLAGDAGEATVLQSGGRFAPPPGGRDLDLVEATLAGESVLSLPDTGQLNIVLILDGSIQIGPPGGGQATLLAGEAATFGGAIDVSSTDGGTVVAAILGAALPKSAIVAPASPTVPSGIETTPTATEPTPAATAAPSGTGSIAFQVLNCPPGTTPESFDPAACALTQTDFDVTLSGPALDAPLTLEEATAIDGGFIWQDVPFGDYFLAEAVLPVGYADYAAFSGDRLPGSIATGYQLTLGPDTPEIVLYIFNFATP